MTKDITKVEERSLSELNEDFKRITVEYDPNNILRAAEKELAKVDGKTLTAEGSVAKAMTIHEFSNGALMSVAVSDQYRTLAIHMMRELQKEFDCTRTDEKATAELAVVNYIRTLDIQRRMNGYLEKGSITDMGVRYLGVMSKDLDRANRQYLSAIYALKTSKQTPFVLNVKTDTAILGQNQLVQAKT